MAESVCELPQIITNDEEIVNLLTSSHTVAVVGLSDKPERDSYQVALYLKSQGYRIIPVNPNLTEALGERAYASLADIPESIAVDVVDIFRKPEYIPEIVDQAIARKVRGVWMQKGLVHNAAAQRARAAGLVVVMDHCMMVEHRRLIARQ